jgi:hypothetical protein
MKKMTYLMMLALGISAVSSNINAESPEEKKERKAQRKQKRQNRKNEIKKNLKKTCSNAGRSILKGDVKGAIGDLKKGMDEGLEKWKNDGTLLPMPPQVINEIQSNANTAYAKAENLANAGDRKEAKKIIDDWSEELSKKMDSAMAAMTK